METLDLPSLVNILSYLDFCDRFNAELVCKRWRKALSYTTCRSPIDIRIYFVADIQIRRCSAATIDFGGVFFEKLFPTSLTSTENENVKYNREICQFFAQLLQRYGSYVGGVYLGGSVNNLVQNFPEFDEYSSIRTVVYPNFLRLFDEFCPNISKFSLKIVNLQAGALNVFNAKYLGSKIRSMCFDYVFWAYSNDELLEWEANIPRWDKLGFCHTSVYILNSVAESLKLKDEYLDELHIYGRPFDMLAIEAPDENFYSIFAQSRRITLNVDIAQRKYTRHMSIALEQCFVYNSNITRLELTLHQFCKDTSELFAILQYLENTLEHFKLSSFERMDDPQRSSCILNNDQFLDLMTYLSMCRRLKSLYLNRVCRGVADFSPLVDFSSTLESFGLDGADDFDEHTLILFVMRCAENLRALSLHNCPQIAGFHLRRVLDYAPSLVTLEAVWCGNMTDSLGRTLVRRAAVGSPLEYCRLRGRIFFAAEIRAQLRQIVPVAEFQNTRDARLCFNEATACKWKNFKKSLIPRFDACEFCDSIFSING